MKIPKPVKLKSGAWRIQLRLNGESITYYGSTESECKRNALLAKAEYLSGKVIHDKCHYTVTSAIDKYITDHPRLSPSTIRGYRSIQRNMFQSAMPLDADAVNWQKVIDADEHATKTVKNAWGFISTVLRYIGLQPPKINLPQLTRSERAFLQPEQIQTFIDSLRGQPCEIAALLGLHSLRRSEILDMTYGDVDLANGLIRVRGAAVMDEHGKVIHKKINKNAASTRTVPIMIPRLAELLKTESKTHSKTDYIVSTHPSTLYHQINSVCKRNGLPEIGVHGLRHSMVSLCYHLGWTELSTMQVAGYSDFNTMRKIYTHLADSDRKRNVSDMQAFYRRTNS